MDKQPPLNWLRSFEAAARHSSFTRAALELNITQAAISKQIKALESSLNCQLFQRHANGLQLTEQGRRYWSDIRGSIHKLGKITSQFISRQQSNRIHLRCNISYGTLVIPHVLQTFKLSHPDFSIEMTHDIWSPLEHSDNAHIELGYGPLQDLKSSETTQILGNGLLSPIVTPTIEANEVLLTLPLIHVKGYYEEWQWWLDQAEAQTSKLPENTNSQLTAFCQQHRGRDRSADWLVDNSLVAYQLAMRGLGIALGREGLVQGYLAKKELRHPPAFPKLEAPEGFIVRLTTQGQGHPAAEALFTQLLEY